MEENQNYLLQRIEVMQKEIERLNNELRKVKTTAHEITLSDPNFDKPLSEIEVFAPETLTKEKLFNLTKPIY